MTANTDETPRQTAGTTERGETERAFVLGLDGVPWNLVERWAASGKLPNFARIIEEGAAGPLRSTTPATTALAWPSIATGVWPDKHGIYGFQKLSSDHRHRIHTSNDVEQPELWDVLSPAVVANVPMTYPADEIDGTLVAGMMTPKMDEQFTHPSEVAAEIAAEIPAYEVGLQWSEYANRKAAFADEIASLVEARRELMRSLMEPTDWRLFFFVYTAPDRLQHLIWDESVLLDHYQQLDDILGEILEYVSRLDGELFVVSDHGFGPVEKWVYPNRILETEGYLSRRETSGTRGILADIGITRENVRTALGTIGIDDETLLRYLPRSFVNTVAAQVAGDHALYDVDFSNTVAFVHGSGNLYINDTRRFSEGCVDPSATPAVKRDLKTMLSGITDPETGDPALVVSDGDELFPTDDESPDLIVKGAKGYGTATSLTDEAFGETEAMAASHRPEGIFLAWGPAIEAGTTPTDATVVDLAPTVLHSLGEPVPENADGRVLEEIFQSASEPVRRSIETQAYTRSDSAEAVTEDFDDVEDRLRGLGYIE